MKRQPQVDFCVLYINTLKEKGELFMSLKILSDTMKES